MPNNFDINSKIGDLKTLNAEIVKLTNNIGKLLEVEKNLTSEISKSKGQADLNKKVNQVKQQQNEIEKAGNKLLSTRNTLVAKQSQALKPLTKEVIKQQEAVKRMNKELRDQVNAEAGIKKRSGIFKEFTKSILAAGAAMIGLNKAKDIAIDISKMAASADGVIKAFKKIPESTKILNEMKEATKGTVSELNLMKAAVKAREFNIPIEKMGTMMAFAAKQAEVMGEDIDYMVESITTGLARGSVQILDNLGLSAKELREEAKKTGDISSAAFSVMNKKLQESGGLLENVNSKQQRWTAIIDNLKLKAGKFLNDFIFNTKKSSEALRAEQIELNALVSATTNSNNTQETRIKLIKELQSKYPNFLQNLDTENVTNEQLRDRLKEVNSEYKKKISLLVQQELVAKNQEQLVNLQIKELDLLKEIGTLEAGLEKLRGNSNIHAAKGRAILNQSINETTIRLERNRAKQKELTDELEKDLALLSKLTPEQDKHTDSVIENTKAVEKNAEGVKKYNEEALESEEDFFSGWYFLQTRQRDEYLKKVEEKEKAEKEFFDWLEKKEAERENKQIKRLDKELAAETEYIEKRKQLIAELNDQLANSAIELGNALFDIGQNRRDKELSSITNNYQAQIAAAEGNTERQEQLAAQLAEEQKRINIQQAKSERNQALFNLAVNTAMRAGEIQSQVLLLTAKAAVNPLLAPLIPLAQAQLGLLLGSAAIQAGVIASQPLPGFFQGTEDAPAGLAWVAEKGRELIETKNGTFLADKPQILNFEGGEKVKTNFETEKILNGAIMNDIAINGNKGLEDRIDELIYATKNQPREVTSFDDQGIQRYLMSGNSKVNYLNRKGK